MVLQNKFKARASRRYNAARGGASDGRGRGRGGGRRGGGRSNNHEAFPSLPGQEGDEDEEGEEGEDTSSGEEGRDASVEKKFARRKLQSNAWRYQEDEKPVKEGTGEESEEEEPEVDLSGIFERVAKLDSNRTTQALSSQQAADFSLEDKEKDLDHTLLYLLDRQRERERGKAVADGSEITAKTRVKGTCSLTPSELKMLEMEGRRLLEENEREKKHFNRAQLLKSGGRQKTANKVISINIGDNNSEGSRHREEERKQKQNQQQEHSFRKNVQASRQISTTALYDDEEDDDDNNNTNNKAGKGEDDEFISQLSSPPSHRIHTSNNIESRKRDPPATEIRTKQAAAPLKEQQDFLDSII